MAKIDVMPHEGIISGFRGVIDFYYCRGIACARKWPVKPKYTRSPAVKESWPIFAKAASLWNELSPEIRRAYEAMAQASGLSGRDMFTRSYMAGFKMMIEPPGDLP